MTAGDLLYRAHVAFQRATLPIRERRAKQALKPFLAPLARQEAEARRRHGNVKDIQAARAALIVHALSHRQQGA